MPEEKQTMLEDLRDTPKLAPLYLPTNDPRPDLAKDSRAWGRLLSLAHGEFGEDDPLSLFWILQGMRCMGTTLVKSGAAWRLDAGGNPDYAADRERYLVPHRDDVRMLLSKLDA